MRKRRVLKTIILSFIIIVLIAILAALVIVLSFISKHGDTWKSLKNSALSIADNSTREDFCTALTSTVYYNDGSVVTSLKAEKDVYYLDYDKIPKLVIDTFVSVEDKRFYEHKGVDYIAIVRAAWSLYTNKEITQGGSTITQQLSRNTYLSHEVSWDRKITELFLARALETKYSKEDILEFYINNVYFANGNYGIQSAAMGYFQKDVSELSLAEVVFLCAIPNNPEKYDPLVKLDAVISRRNQMLNTMYELGVIKKEEYKEALVEKINLKVSKTEKSNFVETYIFECAVDILEGRGYTRRDALAGLYTKGYGIYTSIDKNLQKELQMSLDANLATYTEVNEEGIYELQGAAVTIDNATGKVVAIVGGRSQAVEGYTLNRAFQSFRQPGSAIKPLVTYTPLLAEGYTADTIVMDEKKEGGPANSNNRYSGPITVRDAVAHSKNTVAWTLFGEVTAAEGLGYLLAMNFEKIVAEDYVPAASLGGLTYGTSVLEMTAAYATIANEGKYRYPGCITKITDADGKVIYESSQIEKEIYSPYASVVMTDILTSVMDYGTGKSAALDGITCAGKTGTTDKNKDGWFIGYTAYYTTGVWVGYDMPREMEDLYGYTYPSRIWKAYMQEIHSDLEDIRFTTPAEYLEAWEEKQREEADKSKNESGTDAPDETENLKDAGTDWEDDITIPDESSSQTISNESDIIN